MNIFLKRIARLLFFFLLVFEFLNYIGILHYTLDFSWLGLIVTLLFVWLLVEIISLFLKKHNYQPLKGWVLIMVVIAIYIDAFGDILHLYSQFDWYDQLMHLIGGATTAAVSFNVLYQIGQRTSIFKSSFISLATSSLLGTFYEIEEYLEDYFTGSHRLGDGPDTANDLLLNLVGALLIIIAVIVFYYFKRRYLEKN